MTRDPRTARGTRTTVACTTSGCRGRPSTNQGMRAILTAGLKRQVSATKTPTQSYRGDVSTADELMGLAAGLRRVVRRRLRAELPGPALRGAQVELLQLVEAEPGVGVAAAARSLHLAGNTVSTLVNQLVA